MAHIEIHLNWDELPPDGTVFGVGYVVPDGGDTRSMDARPGEDYCPTCGREYRGRVLAEVPSPPCPDCRQYDPKPMADVEPASARAIATAEAKGGDAGENAAATWLLSTVRSIPEEQRLPRLQQVLQALEDHDQDTLDAYNVPKADLSGEWADTLSGPRLVDACTEGMNVDEEGDLFTDICQAYEQAFSLSAQAHLRAMIAEEFGDKNPWELLPKNYPMTKADIDALFDLIPGARDALQGLEIDNTAHIWDNIALNMEGMLVDGFTRDDLRKRTAATLRVMVYGEWVDEAYPS